MSFRQTPFLIARTFLGLSLATLVVGCGRGGDSPKSSPGVATAREPARTTDEVTTPKMPTVHGERPRGTNFPPARPNLTPAPGTPPASALGAVRDAATTTTKEAVDFVVDVALPGNADRNTREAGLAEARQQGDQYRRMDPAQLKHALTLNSVGAEDVKALLRSRGSDDVTKLLSRYLTETDQTRAAASASLLISEVFSDADYAASKLAEISFDLGEVARKGLYDEAIASRVALLQAQFDHAISRDHWQNVAKVALFVAGSAVTTGFFAGREMKYLDRATGAVRKIHVDELLKGKTLQNLAKDAYGTVTSLEKMGAVATKITPKPPVDALRAELKVLEFTDTEMSRMGLQKAKVRDIAYLAGDDKPAYAVKPVWEKTNRDRVQYYVSSHWNGDLGDHRVILFKVNGPLGKSKIIAGPRLPEAEATALAQRLEYKPNVDFLTQVEGDQLSQSTIRADTREEFASAPARGPFVERLGPTPETPEFAPRQPLPEATPRKFNYVRAAIAATAIGVITTPPAYLAFAYGDRDGRDAENLYLERQVDRLRRPAETVVSDLNQK